VSWPVGLVVKFDQTRCIIRLLAGAGQDQIVISAPRFSIIVTCCNQRDFILDAVDSALSQPYADREIIVVDDGSTDGSQNLLERYGTAIRLETSQKNGGPSHTRNLGASKAIGDYLVFLDGDDLLATWALDIYDGIVEAKNPALILGKLHFFRDFVPLSYGGAGPKNIELIEYYSFLLEKDRPYRQSASSTVVHRQAFLAVNGWDTELPALEDYDLTLSVGHSGRTIQISSPATVFYRVHGANLTNDENVLRVIESVYRLIRKEREGRYPGGAACRYARYAFIGGAAFGWLKRALETGYYWEALKLSAKAAPMIAAAIVRRLTAVILGKRRTQTIGK
jgi:glycosyltransferase involved in cell wall biosynthesis